MFSSGFGSHSLSVAQNDVTGALNLIRFGHGTTETDYYVSETNLGQVSRINRELAHQGMQQFELAEEHFEALSDLLEWLDESFLDEQVRGYLDDRHPNWVQSLNLGERPLDQFQISLRNPDSELDSLSQRISEKFPAILDSYGLDFDSDSRTVAELLHEIGTATHLIWEEVPTERETKIYGISFTLNRWISQREKRYYRAIDAEASKRTGEYEAWSDAYNVSFELYNCIPTDELASIFEDLGGGIVMSATLEPIDIYLEEIGLKSLEKEGRQLDTATYSMHYPEENRGSLLRSLPPFTYKNRGQPVERVDDMTPVRRQYVEELVGVATTNGNILFAMPSYREAEWLKTIFSQRSEVDKAIYVDEPGTETAVTTEMLNAFWGSNQSSILVTSLQGTVTEGIDFHGDRLHTAVVVGLPISNTQDDHLQAVQDAYEERFENNNSFEQTFSIPAVRRARQAIGRVIRSESDEGVRIFLDERYGSDRFNSVKKYLSDAERNEFQEVSDIAASTQLFWDLKRT